MGTWWTALSVSLACCWLLPVPAEGARILAVLPMPAKSHQAVLTPVLRELAARGHEVTAYVPYPLPNPPKTYKEVLLPEDLFQELHSNIDVVEFGKKTALEQVMMLHEIGLFIQKKILSLESVQRLIHSDEEYDAVILESFFVQESFAAFHHKFKAVPIEILPLGSSYWVSDLVGNPNNPSYILDFKSPFTDRMSFCERLHNTVVGLGTALIGYWLYMPKTQVLMSYYFNYTGPRELPYVTDLLADKALVLVNSHPAAGYAYPMNPNVVEVGGIHIGPTKPLPKDLQVFMDEAKEGVIYFSLGSNINVSSITKDGIFTAFNGAFGKLKQKVLWKWEKDEFPNQPPNVKTSKWFPQQDILAHKNCKLFITHGGYLSVTEAVNFGVPLVGIPFFGDQPKNMKQVTSAGYGVQLDFGDITEGNILAAVNEVLNNPSYREKAKSLSVLFRDRPMTALESAIYWIEYVIKYKGAPHLRSAAASNRWYVTALADVVAFMIAAALSLALFVYLAVRKLFRLLCSRKPQPEKRLKKKTN